MLSAGVYVSSFMKDLCCVPRPYAPPVTRLSEFSLALFGGPTESTLRSHRQSPPRVRLSFDALYEQRLDRALLL